MQGYNLRRSKSEPGSFGVDGGMNIEDGWKMPWLHPIKRIFIREDKSEARI